ncbi:MAG: hypothetical protein ABWZ57_17270 [Mesorhizobium sp.]
MQVATAKLLRFPNGHEMTSDEIKLVNVVSGPSPIPFLQIFDAWGLVYEGPVDLDAVVVRERRAPRRLPAGTRRGISRLAVL